MRRTIVLWLALFVVFLAALRLMRGPAPKPAGAPPTEFSAARARAVLQEVIGDAPHPLGSAEHDRVRDRVVARLRAYGYETTVQSRFACDPHAFCAPVQNVIAQRPGDPLGKAVFLTAHYDSVAAGPGVSDDGVGVATMLEIARALRAETLRNPVVFVIDDGEEAGLIGAEALVADPVLAARVGAIVNVENRGTAGSSYLFETSRRNRWLVPLVARALPRPVTASLFVSIYELLPNDTDLTVFKRAGMEGVNFASIGNVHAYHTPLDNQVHADVRLLQHHGDNALAAARALANADLTRRSGENVVHFDLLGLFVVWWPEGWTVWLAIVGLLVSIAALVREREGALTALAAFFVSLAAAFAAGFVIVWLLRLRTGDAKWIAHPVGAIAAMWLVGVAVGIFVCSWARRRAAGAPLAAIALAWNLLGIAVTFALRGGSYLFIVPGIVLAIAALVWGEWGAIAGAVVAAALWMPFGLVLYEALGLRALPLVAVMLALIATPFASWQDRRIAAALAVLGAIALLFTIVRPVHTDAQPQRVNFAYLDDGAEALWVSAIKLPGATPRVTAPWYKNAPAWWVEPAPKLGLAPVEMQIASDTRAEGKRHLVVDIRSPRGASRLALMFRTKATVDAVTINGIAPPPPTARTVNVLAPEWHRVVVHAPAARVEIVTRGWLPIELTAADYSYGLPAQAAPLLRARAEAHGVPSDEGDLTITLRRAGRP